MWLISISCTQHLWPWVLISHQSPLLFLPITWGTTGEKACAEFIFSKNNYTKSKWRTGVLFLSAPGKTCLKWSTWRFCIISVQLTCAEIPDSNTGFCVRCSQNSCSVFSTPYDFWCVFFNPISDGISWECQLHYCMFVPNWTAFNRDNFQGLN